MDSNFNYEYEKKELKYKTFTNSLIAFLTNTLYYFIIIGIPVSLIIFIISFFYDPVKI
jgi:hypothetical protein